MEKRETFASNSLICSSAITELKTSTSVFKWTIKNFSMCPHKVGECLVSPSFPGADGIFWQIKCFPRGDCEKRNDILCVYLQLAANKLATVFQTSPIAAEFKLSIVKASEKLCHVATSERVQLYDMGQSWGMELMNRDVLLNPKYGYLLNDILTMSFQVTAVLGTIVTSDLPDVLGLPGGINDQLSEDLEALLNDGMHHDIIFFVGDKQYSAHKSILAARSSVFRKMFDEEETLDNYVRVEVSDMNPSVLQQVLYFIYTGKIGQIEKNVAALLNAADRYGLHQLKTHCENVLCAELSYENALDFLVLSDLYSAYRLKDEVITFINRNPSFFARTDHWKSIIKLYPHLLFEVYAKLARA